MWERTTVLSGSSDAEMKNTTVGFIRQAPSSFLTTFKKTAPRPFRYTYEQAIGTTLFMTRFLTTHVVLLAILGFLELEQESFKGCEPTLVTLACLLHFENPKVAPQAVQDQFVQVRAFTVEPRWHCWVLCALLLIFGSPLFGGVIPWSTLLAQYTVAVACGTLWAVRYPSVRLGGSCWSWWSSWEDDAGDLLGFVRSMIFVTTTEFFVVSPGLDRQVRFKKHDLVREQVSTLVPDT